MSPATSDPLLTAAKRWNKRIQIGTNAGLNPAAIQSVQKADLNKVSMGGTGMSDQEALAAISSAASGQTAQQHKASTSIMGIPGRLVADVGNTLTGLAIGATHVVEHPARDVKGAVRGVGETLHELPAIPGLSTVGAAEAAVGVHPPSTAWQQSHGYEGGGGLAAQVRNVAKTPVGRFIPGTMTAANVTTPAGRKEMLAHPGYTVADVLPYASTTVKTLAALGHLGDVAEEGSVAEAAARGEVAKTGVRAAARGLQRLTGGRYGLGLPTLDKVLTEYGATRLASQVIGQLHDWAKNLAPADKELAWRLFIENHPGYENLYDPLAVPFPTGGGTDTGAHSAWNKRRLELQQNASDMQRNYANLARQHEQRVAAMNAPPPAGPAVDPSLVPETLRGPAPEGAAAAAAATSGHPPELTFPQGMNWSEVKAFEREGLLDPTGSGQRIPIEVSRTEREGWYIRPKGAPEGTPEILIPRSETSKGYVTGGPSAPPLPGPRAAQAARDVADPAGAQSRMDRALANAHVDSRTAAQALAEHLAAEPSRPPVEQTLSPAQETLKEVWDAGGPAGPNLKLLRTLPADQQRLITGAYRDMGKLLALGDLARQGIVRTASDIEGEALRLDPALRDQYFNSWRHFDPLEQMRLGFLKQNPDVLQAIPGLAQDQLDLAAAYSMPADVYNALFGDRAVGDKVTGVLSERRDQGGLGRFSSRYVMGPFRAAIWLRPTMVANIAVRGLIQALGQEGPELLSPRNLIDAFSMRGDPTVAAGFKNLSTDQVHSLLGSATLGRILNTIPGGMRRASNTVASIQRALVFVTEHRRMIEAGASEDTARMAGMQAIRDALVTHDAMTPIEQSIVRQIFPFYAYQKMLFQYLAGFPAEHPFVTEVVSKIGRQETELNASGLPLMMQQMFQIGSPDQNGNVKAIDVRGFNPFRNFANDMTLTGLAMNANPALKVLMEAFGVNPAKGTPELYPGLTFNPQTGSLEAARPKLSLATVAESVIPQLGTVDAMLGFNNRLKYLKQTDPSAYRAMLFQTVGIPMPQTVNVPAETAHAEESLYRLSQTAVSNFLKSGDSGYISGWSLLPYSSRWWTPDQLEQFYNGQAQRIRSMGTAATQPGGAGAAQSLKALLTPPPRTTAQLPPTASA